MSDATHSVAHEKVVDEKRLVCTGADEPASNVAFPGNTFTR